MSQIYELIPVTSSRIIVRGYGKTLQASQEKEITYEQPGPGPTINRLVIDSFTVTKTTVKPGDHIGYDCQCHVEPQRSWYGDIQADFYIYDLGSNSWYLLRHDDFGKGQWAPWFQIGASPGVCKPIPDMHLKPGKYTTKVKIVVTINVEKVY